MAGDDFAITAGWGHFGQGDAVMPGQGRVAERAYTPVERATIAGAITALGETTFDIHLNRRVWWCNVPAAVWRSAVMASFNPRLVSFSLHYPAKSHYTGVETTASPENVRREITGSDARGVRIRQVDHACSVARGQGRQAAQAGIAALFAQHGRSTRGNRRAQPVEHRRRLFPGRLDRRSHGTRKRSGERRLGLPDCRPRPGHQATGSHASTPTRSGAAPRRPALSRRALPLFHGPCLSGEHASVTRARRARGSHARASPDRGTSGQPDPPLGRGCGEPAA